MSYRNAVLADTGPLLAAVNPDDQYHARAHAEIRRLDAHRTLIIVIWPTLMETQSLVVKRLGMTVAQRWLQEILEGTEVEHPTDRDLAAAAGLLRRYADHPMTLFDATLFVVSQRLTVPIWTYDHHFDILGATRWYAP